MRDKLWTKDFITISSIFFLVALVFYLLMVTMASYASSALQASESMAGLVTGIFILGALLGRVLTSSLMLRVGPKITLLGGLILFNISSSLYFFGTTIPLLLAIRLFHGVSTGITLNAAATIVALLVPQSRRAEGLGYFSTASVLSAALGPFLGIFLIQRIGLSPIFAFSLVLGLLSFLLALTLQVPTQDHQPARSRLGFHLQDIFEPRTLPIALVILVMGFAYASILSFITLYAKAIDQVTAASFFFFVYSVSIIATRPFFGPLADRRGPNLVAYPAMTAYFLGLILLSQARHSFTLLAAAAVIGAGYGNFTSVAQTLAISRVDPSRISASTTTFFIFVELGMGISPYLLGSLIATAGYRTTYLSMSGVVLLGILIYHVYCRKDTRSHSA